MSVQPVMLYRYLMPASLACTAMIFFLAQNFHQAERVGLLILCCGLIPLFFTKYFGDKTPNKAKMDVKELLEKAGDENIYFINTAPYCAFRFYAPEDKQIHLENALSPQLQLYQIDKSLYRLGKKPSGAFEPNKKSPAPHKGGRTFNWNFESIS